MQLSDKLGPALPKLWAIVPAAGLGSRIGAEKPKQYLAISGRTMLEITLEKLLSLAFVEGVVLALHPKDQYWQYSEYAHDARIVTVPGGHARSHSVLHGLAKLREVFDRKQQDHQQQWVMVHDAARPCVSAAKISKLYQRVQATDCGAILAEPITSTIKKVDATLCVQGTENRELLWAAHTPQIFRCQELSRALDYCHQRQLNVTDEASAIEQAGGKVQVLQDSRNNIKVTVPEDVPLAEFILSR